MALLLCSAWLLFFYFGTLMNQLGPLRFDPSELTIITLYASYIPIFINMLRRGGEHGFVRGRLMPVLTICCCVFMVAAAFIGSFENSMWYLVVFAVLMLTGVVFDRKAG